MKAHRRVGRPDQNGPTASDACARPPGPGRTLHELEGRGRELPRRAVRMALTTTSG